jgi:hypothetical protein
MRRIAVFLVFLLPILTFNAYACVLPLQTVSEKDCSSETKDQARQTCDAFLEIGPQSQISTNHAINLFTFEAAVPTQLLVIFNPVFTPTPPPRHATSPIHLSIPITVLRI